MRNIGIKQMFGLKGNLIVQGPFRFSRNPEYLGFISLLISGLIISGSIYVFYVNFIGITWFLLAPLTEEKWLYEQFGESYARYTNKVPRFFSLKRFKKKN
jgi:protein-S-isoprenylcysteine O-methyltransferase Ste14